MEIRKISNTDFDSEVLKEMKTVLVDFNADWCGPCRMLSPILEEIAEGRQDVKIVSVNIDDEEKLAEKYGVSSIPCLVVFRDGNEINRSVGLKPKDVIIELLEG